jgi:hypothetical protein
MVRGVGLRARRQEAASECCRILRAGGTKIAHTIGHAQLNSKVVFKFFPEIKQCQLEAYPSDGEFKTYFKNTGFQKTEIIPYLIERYQTADEFISRRGNSGVCSTQSHRWGSRGVAELKRWKMEHPEEPIRNDEMITLFVGRK